MNPAGQAEVTAQIILVTSASDESHIAQARALLLEYGEFLRSQPAAAHVCMGSLQNEAERLPLSYEEQGGGTLLAQVQGDPAGFVAWRIVPGPFAAHAWEIKRLWVRSSARGLNLGRSLTQSVLDRASAASRSAVYLDTIPSAMPQAHNLYLHMGFAPCDPYSGPAIPGVAYLAKYL